MRKNRGAEPFRFYSPFSQSIIKLYLDLRQVYSNSVVV